MVRCGAGAEGLQKKRGEDSSDMEAIYWQYTIAVDMWLLGYLPPHVCGPRTIGRVGLAVGAFVVRVIALDDGIVTERGGGAAC